MPLACNGDGHPPLFLVGAGAYAYAYILPNLPGMNRYTVIDLNPVLAAVVGEKFSFVHRESSCSAAFKRLGECAEPVLVIATYHSTHVDIAEEALSENPRTKIFMEKPPVTNHDQLRRLLEMRRGGAFVEIGYNRRHAPMAVEAFRLIREKGNGPVAMTCIIKELSLPTSHWYYWPTQGTRVTGNLCHWIDLGTAVVDAAPKEVTVVTADDARPGDELTAIVVYRDGSRLTLVATDRGNPLRGVQEYIDIRRGDLTVTIDDFLVMTVQEGGKKRVRRSIIRDKGHARMYRDFSRRVRDGSNPSYPHRDLLVSSMIYLSVVEGVAKGGGTVSFCIDDAYLP
jgi:predicted dehydrogenase